MLPLPSRIKAFSLLGEALGLYLKQPEHTASAWLRDAVQLAGARNGWFTQREVHHTLDYWANALNTNSLQNFIAPYTLKEDRAHAVGLVLAGNIPMVGFHDVLCTVLTGHRALIKCSASDDVLLPALLAKLVEIEPAMAEQFTFVGQKMEGYTAVIATGSNNSARYFEHYFGNVPHIVRRNRTGVAVLDGSETTAQLSALMDDCFRYYGLGCRNVTKLYLPTGFDLNRIFEASLAFSYLMDNKKYANNHAYHKALMMLERKPFLENDLILLRADTALWSPVGVLNYEFYEDNPALNESVAANLDHLQCVVGKGNLPFGSAQQPRLNDFADGVDTVAFLFTLAAS